MRHHLRPLIALLALTLPCQGARAGTPEAAPRAAPPSAAWSAEIRTTLESLPVQDGGRIKPLHTYASFLLLRLNGKRSLTTPEGQKLDAVDWFLDALFRPEVARHYPVFLVQDDQAIEAIGLGHEGKKKRDRYTFEELEAGVPRLFELARQYGAIEEKARSSVEQQVFLLANNVNEYLMVQHHLDYAREVLPVAEGPGLAQIFGGERTTTFAGVLDRLTLLRDLQRRLAAEGQHGDELKAVSTLLRTTADLTSGTESLPLFAPLASVAQEPAWLTPADLMTIAFEHGHVVPVHLQMLEHLQNAARNCADPAVFAREVEAFAASSRTLAEARGEYEKVGLELTYYKLDLLGKSQAFFVLAFVLACAMWLRPKSRVLYWSTAAAVLVPTLLLVGAIVMRCLIRERPPVSTLYETVLFVTAVGGLTALVAELISRNRIALSAAAVLGLIGLFVASGYETLDKRDTMPTLVAVLDTNFWLATHVTAITIGYSAGVLAALLANVYLVLRMLGIKKGEPEFHKSLARTVYGVVCFGLIFSVVGTILGGIWANESWGRFWGWDPKENGALLIVLSQLVMLHLRLAGLVRDFGLCMAAAFGGTVVGFSWWGVNLLGVGLHSYGFTSGIHTALWTYYLVQWGLIALAGLHLYVDRARAAAARAALLGAGAPVSGSREVTA